MGRSGPRLIAGDLNHDAGSLCEVQIWRRVEAQELALARWGREVCPTSKGAKVRDFLFLSLEAAALCRQVEVRDIFQQHSLVVAWLSFEASSHTFEAWPLPSKIPWQHVDLHSWHGRASFDPPRDASSFDWMRSFARQLEASLDGHLQVP